MQVALHRPATLWSLVLVSIAIVLTFLQIAIPMRGISDSQYFWLSHADGVSVATMGKWSGQARFADGMSGEFSMLYQYFPGWLINRLSDLFRLPAFEMEFYAGAFLPAVLLITSHIFIRAMIGSDLIALVAAILITLSSDPILVDPLYSWMSRWDVDTTKTVFHVPAAAIALGTSQGFAYALFVPALVAIYLAVIRESIVFTIVGGLLLGLLIQSSFLTFVGVVSAAGVGLTCATLVRHFVCDRIWLVYIKGAALALTIPAILYAARNHITTFHLVALWCILFLIPVHNVRSVIILAGIFTVAIATASPLILFIAKHWSSLGGLDLPHNSVTPVATIIIFFLPAWIAVVALPFIPVFREKRLEIAFLLGGTAALLLFSKGEAWGFQNHQYRFAITLLFPLSILFAVAVLSPWKSRARWILAAMLVWSAVSVLRNVSAIAGVNEKTYNALGKFHYWVSLTSSKAYDPVIHAFAYLATQDKQAGSRRILLPPESRNEPQVMMRNALLLSVSPLPGYLPDNRHIFDWAAYTDRMRIFCFLFPDYMLSEFDREHRVCDGIDGQQIFDQGRAIAEIRNPQLKINILRVLGIRMLADLDTSFSALLRKYAQAYGLTALFSSAVGTIMEIPKSNKLPVMITNGGWQDGTWTLVINAEKADEYTVMVAGIWLDRWFADIKFTDVSSQQATMFADSWIGTANLSNGRNLLRLTACPSQARRPPVPELAPIQFIAVVPAREIDRHISLDERALAQSKVNPCQQPLPTVDVLWRSW